MTPQKTHTRPAHLSILLAGILLTTLLIVATVQATQVHSQTSQFQLLETFDNLQTGNINDQGSWVANEPGAADGAVVDAVPPRHFSGKALRNNPDNILSRGNAYLPLGPDSLAQGTTGTLFFQISVDALNESNVTVGLSDLNNPDIYANSGIDDFAAAVNFSSAGLRVGDGNTDRVVTNIPLQNDTLYHVWLVADTANDTFQVYVEGGTLSAPVQAQTSSGSTFSFRHALSGALSTFVIFNVGLNSGDSYIDNLYVDTTGANTANPGPRFVAVGDFDTLATGTLNGREGWVATDKAEVVTDPAASSNRVLRLPITNQQAYKTMESLANNSTGTLHFRLRRSAGVDGFFGLSDEAAPDDWSAFEAQFGTQAGQSDQFIARDGDQFRTLDGEFSADIWYCIWLVTDNGGDTFAAHVKGGTYDNITRLQGDGQNEFQFRNGGSNGLQTFLARTSTDSGGSLYLDDVYIDTDSVNFGTPGADCDVRVSNEAVTDPIPEPLDHDGAAVQFESVTKLPQTATGEIVPRTNPRTRLNFLYHANDGSGRIFVNDLRGPLYVVDADTGDFQTYLNIEPFFDDWFEDNGLNSGFSTFAFHPDFKNNGLFYTIHTETPNGTPDYDTPNPVEAPAHGVLVEWEAQDPEADTFSGTHREILRIEQASVAHGMQLVLFNPLANPGDDEYGMLYVSHGDGENSPNHTIAPQDLGSLQGTIFRIDPLGNNSPNGKYGIPDDNPFSDSADPDVLKEIYAYGFRNPIRFTWDTGGAHHMIESDVGQNYMEEVNILLPGHNYGWNEREGTFVYDKNDPDSIYPLPPDDAANGYTYAVAQYDHDEGFGIIGGFVYRGTLMPEMVGNYIFGDIVEGRLFYVPVDKLELGRQEPIRELTLLDESGKPVEFRDVVDPTGQRGDLRFGLDQDGEMYIMSKQDGVVRRLVSARRAPGRALITGITRLSTDSAYYHDIVAASTDNANPYTDADYTLESLPGSLQGADLLATLDSEKNVDAMPHLGFQLAQRAHVYVAVDADGSTPGWLNGWAEMGEATAVDTNKTINYRLYMRTFGAGEVLLGGNDGTETGADHNYFVLAVADDTVAPVPTNTPVPVPSGQPTNTPVPVGTGTPVSATPTPPTPTPPTPVLTSTPFPTEANQNGSVSGLVWYDFDRDSLLDSDEYVLGNVYMNLVWPGPDGSLGNQDDVTQTTHTEDNGTFSMRGLPSGPLRVIAFHKEYGSGSTSSVDFVLAAGEMKDNVLIPVLGVDFDGDSIPDTVEGGEDADGNGTPNYADTDADGDNIPDVMEGLEDANGNGILDFLEAGGAHVPLDKKRWFPLVEQGADSR